VWRIARLTTSVIDAAREAMRALVGRSAGAHRLRIVDYLLGAAAQELGAPVRHYDHDYDTLAEVVSFDSVWLVSPGSFS
jgi:predicted nucleic acid-binding protein